MGDQVDGGSGARTREPVLEELEQALRSGELVIFAGPGVSTAGGLPGPCELAEVLAERAQAWGADAVAVEEIRDLARKQRYAEALSAAKVLLGEAEFGHEVERALDDKDREIPEVARAIAALAPRLRAIATTNLDHLLEHALEGQRWRVLAKATGDIARRRQLLMKLHGTLLDRSTWVLTREDHERAMYLDGRYQAAFSALFNTCPLLFVAYNLDDEDFRQIVGRARALSGEQPPRHYALVPEEVATPFRRRALAAAGVVLIPYRNGDRQHLEAVRILRELAERGATKEAAGAAEVGSLEEALAGLRDHVTACAERWTEEDERRFVPARAEVGGETLAVEEAIQRALTRARCALVLGNYGSGKSTHLRRLAWRMARAHLQDPTSRPAPLHLRLSGRRPDLEAIIAAEVPGISAEAVRQAISLGRVVPLLDGLDELKMGPHEVGSAIALLTGFPEGSRARMVLSGRDTLFATEQAQEAIDRPESIARVRLLGFDKVEIATFVRRHTANDAAARDTLARIGEVHDLQNLAERPGLLELVVASRERLRGAERVTATSLYALVEEAWLESRAQEEEVVPRAQRRAFARSLARALFLKNESAATYKEVLRHVVEILDDQQAWRFPQALHEVQKAAFLEPLEGQGEEEAAFRFVHRSFAEYFLAMDIAQRLDADDREALALPMLSQEIVGFLSELQGWDGRLPKLRQTLTQAYQKSISENALLCLVYAARRRTEDTEALCDLLMSWLPSGVQLAGADLDLLPLAWVALPGADLRGASLSFTILQFADLRGAKLDGADANDARFDGARLEGASFVGAELSDATFLDAVTTDVQWKDSNRQSVFGLRAADAADETAETTPRIEPHRLTSPIAAFWSPAHPRVLVREDLDGERTVWDMSTGAVTAMLASDAHGTPAQRKDETISPDGYLRVAISEDGSLHISSVPDGRPLLVCLNDRVGWLSYIPGTPFFHSGGNLHHFVEIISRDLVMPLSLWAPLFRRPDLIQAALQGHLPDLHALGLTGYAACYRALTAERARRGLIRRRPAERMVIESLRVENLKLLAGQTFSFRRLDGSLRLWTVLIGDNGLCKTTILQAIALAASGEKIARALVDDAGTFCRAASPARSAAIEAVFRLNSSASHPDRLVSHLVAEPNRSDFRAVGEDDARRLDDIRGYRKPGYFVVGYGTGRSLPRPGEASPPTDPVKDRVEGLFDAHHRMLGIDFFDELAKRDLAVDFERVLEEVLRAEDEQGERLLPWIADVELGGKDRIDRMRALLEARRFRLEVGSSSLRLPPTALSQGYQAMIAWIADLLGHAFLELGDIVHPATLEGLVLLDEIDLLLHPTWQRRIVPILKRIFPRLQFIVTTHSPLVLTGFEADEIIELTLEDGQVVQRARSVEPGMQTASELLSSYFRVPRAGRPDLVRKEREYLDLVARATRSAEEEARMRALEAELHRYWESAPGDAPLPPEALGEEDGEPEGPR